MTRILWIPAALIAVIFAGSEALAATATGTFQVTATVVSGCTVSAPALAFGNYDTSSATPTAATTTVSVYCTVGTSFTTALDVGGNGGDYATGRLMLGGTNGDNLSYNLYTDATYTTVWGDGSGATSTVAGVGTGPLVAVPQVVYGRIPAQQNISADSYSDTITVTVTY